MLNLTSRAIARTCDGVRRRDFLQVGSVGAIGLTLADRFATQAHANPKTLAADVDDRACIMIFNTPHASCSVRCRTTDHLPYRDQTHWSPRQPAMFWMNRTTNNSGLQSSDAVEWLVSDNKVLRIKDGVLSPLWGWDCVEGEFLQLAVDTVDS